MPGRGTYLVPGYYIRTPIPLLFWSNRFKKRSRKGLTIGNHLFSITAVTPSRSFPYSVKKQTEKIKKGDRNYPVPFTGNVLSCYLSCKLVFLVIIAPEAKVGLIFIKYTFHVGEIVYCFADCGHGIFRHGVNIIEHLFEVAVF